MNIDKLLNTDEAVFENILKKLFVKNLRDSKNELASKYKFNHKLYEAIDFTLEKLKKEESLWSRVLYSSFGVGKKKNKRRKHLILLGTQLKTEISKLDRDIKRVMLYHKNSLESADALTRFSNGFGKKMHMLDDSVKHNKCNRYLKKTYLVIDIVNKSTKELDERSLLLESSIDKYRTLLKRIPRYHELNDNKYLEHKSK
jgi:hypothetical protein